MLRPSGPPPLQQRQVTVTARRALGSQAGSAFGRALHHLLAQGAGVSAADPFFFGAEQDDIAWRALLARRREKPAHYQLVVRPGDDCDLPDLKAYCRQLMQKVGRARGAELDWLAVEHHGAERTHLHIFLRDETLDGRRLSLPLDYLRFGLSQAAQDVATNLLGPYMRPIPKSTVTGLWFTALDHVVANASTNGVLTETAIPEVYRSCALRRVGSLTRRGFLRPIGPGQWEVPPDLRIRLRTSRLRSRREWTAVRVLKDSAWQGQQSRLESASLEPGMTIPGALVGFERSGPSRDGSQTVVIDAIDGKLCHITVPKLKEIACLDQAPAGAVIQVAARVRRGRIVDETIATVAAACDGIWSMPDHAALRPDDTSKFIKMHRFRLEHLARDGLCAELAEGRFAIPEDFRARALGRDIQHWGEVELKVRVLDIRTVEQQITAPGLTWLDRLMGPEGRPPLSGPFGQLVAASLEARAKALRRTGLFSGDPLQLSGSDLQRLLALECRNVLEPLRERVGAVFLLKEGQKAVGTYVGRVHIAGEPFAILEQDTGAQLAPWTPGMERCRGGVLTAVLQNGEVAFQSLIGAQLRRARARKLRQAVESGPVRAQPAEYEDVALSLRQTLGLTFPCAPEDDA